MIYDRFSIIIITSYDNNLRLIFCYNNYQNYANNLRSIFVYNNYHNHCNDVSSIINRNNCNDLFIMILHTED